MLKSGPDECWERGLRKERERLQETLAWPKEEPGHTFGFPLNPAQLALQISFVLSAVLLWGQLPLVPLHWAPTHGRTTPFQLSNTGSLSWCWEMMTPGRQDIQAAWSQMI